MGLELETNTVKKKRTEWTTNYIVIVKGLHNHLCMQTALIPINTSNNLSGSPPLADKTKQNKKNWTNKTAFLVFLTKSNGSHQERFSDLGEVILGLLVNL